MCVRNENSPTPIGIRTPDLPARSLVTILTTSLIYTCSYVTLHRTWLDRTTLLVLRTNSQRHTHKTEGLTHPQSGRTYIQVLQHAFEHYVFELETCLHSKRNFT